MIVKVLLDTNIIIHRETHKIIRDDIGILFKWFDHLGYKKYLHPHTIDELKKYNDPQIVKSFEVKVGAYNIIQAVPALDVKIIDICSPVDKNDNDKIDTELLNIQYLGITDIFITEDKKIKHKAKLLGIDSNVLTIEEFLEKSMIENPDFRDYRVLSVRKLFFGNVNLADSFFDSFRNDYNGFDKWFRKKNDEPVYVCLDNDGAVLAFLYLKIENKDEVYSDIQPAFYPKKRLKIGTFKVVLNGHKLGERFIKIIFDNAIELKVDEIYVTIFNNSIEQKRLIDLLQEYGFQKHGVKKSSSGEENVYIRTLEKRCCHEEPKCSFPFISRGARTFLVPIYKQYHTNLFPDSILRTESPADFIENEPYRNAISKVYISRSHFKDLLTGDNIIFYRTGGYYESVITTIGIVESVYLDIPTFNDFKVLCGKRSVFSEQELKTHWDYYPNLHPFIVNFLYAYSFPHRINMEKLINLGIIADRYSAPRGFVQITNEQFNVLLKETQTNESIIVD